ncbi:hypothetical protein A2480_03795 [Candidatus Uhrbacteria bacterium RIFOXYC2_FULL_47_19]|uniref:Uncharacterized protein n=1 Tax=Candidatus Uhrbacteria bacterium RIFOXYC2_FULL_47_19 TaxID=1802424 RepID=A0A1F7WG91_9BACT|nr:MAG: hypothetical protein A2480_03795 [Candidatus Uhrbacteria bacterium RIFOXYC2_FULL_47_19]HCC22170.1 hypothetical protein [Candidatus Uhrbacteria bacterium]
MSDLTITKLAGAAGLLSILVMAGLLGRLLGLQPDRWFWSDFLANLFAGVVIVSTAAILLPSYLQRLHRPRLVPELPEDVQLTRYLDGRIKGTVRLVVRNDSDRIVHCFGWHLFLPKRLNAQVTELAPYGKRKTIGTREISDLVYVHGLVEDELIFPQTSFELPVRVWCDTADSRSEWSIRFGLNTETGSFPTVFGLHRTVDAAAAADCLELIVPSQTSSTD